MPLNSDNFIKSLVNEGYTHLCVVPCSFAKNVINSAINSNQIEYVPAASEAVACSIAAGMKIAGLKPVVIVQSSGFTNMVSCITSLLKPYGIKFPIIVSWRTYNRGDSEIHHKHLSTELPKLIKACGFDYEILDKKNLKNSLMQINKGNFDHKLCLIESDTFNTSKLSENHRLILEKYIPRSNFLTSLNLYFKNKDVFFIGTTGNTSREMYTYMCDTKNFYMAGNMGGALSLGFGASKSGKKIIVCGGDAEFVMHMGGLSNCGRDAKSINLTYILFDNKQNKSTGGQNTYQNHMNYIDIAKANNFKVCEKIISKLDEFQAELEIPSGLKFIHVVCGLDDITPRPPLSILKQNSL